MPIDPQMQDVLDVYDTFPVPSPDKVPAKVARQGPTPAAAVSALLRQKGLDPAPPAVGRTDDREISGPDGDIKVRVYWPSGDGPFPVLLYFHGGGWIIADLDTYDASARALTNAAGCIVVSSHYRQAPEHKFPAAVEDAYAAYRWVLDHADELGGDPRRVAVGGESAGGNLATVVCLLARDRGDPLPVHQLLVYPVTDHAFDTPSYREHADAKPLNRDMMLWFWEQYLPDEAAGSDPTASPLRAQDLGGLPAATVITAEIDPLRSEGEAYAERLREAGVPVEATRYDGVTHEFFGMTAVVDKAKQAVEQAAARLRSAFAGGPAAVERSGLDVTARTAERPRVQVDMEVVGSDGERVGRVKEVREADFLVDRSMARDVYVPFDAVTATEGQVVLNVTADEVGEREWPKSSLV